MNPLVSGLSYLPSLILFPVFPNKLTIFIMSSQTSRNKPFLSSTKSSLFSHTFSYKQIWVLGNQPTHLHGHILDFILSLSDQDTIVDVKICDFITDHALMKRLIAFPCQVAYIQIKFTIGGTSVFIFVIFKYIIGVTID